MATLEELKKIYNDCDSDNNGVLSYEEAKKGLDALGKFGKPLSDFKSEFDKLAGSRGSIGFEEFKTLSSQKY